MLDENKNQKKRCDFDGHLVFLDEIFLLLLLLITVLPFHLLFGKQLVENDSWCHSVGGSGWLSSR